MAKRRSLCFGWFAAQLLRRGLLPGMWGFAQPRHTVVMVAQPGQYPNVPAGAMVVQYSVKRVPFDAFGAGSLMMNACFMYNVLVSSDCGESGCASATWHDVSCESDAAARVFGLRASSHDVPAGQRPVPATTVSKRVYFAAIPCACRKTTGAAHD
jgi:hypothetical protein